MTSELKPRTIRLTEDEWDALDTEAEEHGFGSRTEYVRYIIRNRDSIDETTTHQLDQLHDRLDALDALDARHTDRLNHLEARLAELEDQLGETTPNAE